MKDNLFDVLVYLFENYLYEAPSAEIALRDRDSLQANMLDAGFDPTEISRAFNWLDDIDQLREWGSNDKAPRVVRVYSPEESDRLDTDCRGFLLVLEQRGVLDATRREMVLDRLFALDMEQIDLDHLKWVVLMVLFNQPGQEAAYAWMESHLFADQETALN